MTDHDRIRWPVGAASGVGSMPGDDVREAVRVVLGELPDLPHLPELPARGAGADLTGRTVGLLVDLHAEVQPSGWRFTSAPGRDERRARAWLAEDLDTLEELAAGWNGVFKLQAAGPWTLAATLELPNGDKALADPGACRDLASSLAEGLAAHVADVRRRLPGARLLLQLDEPLLPAVLRSEVPTASGLGRLAAVEAEDVRAGLARTLGALPTDVGRIAHCCAADPPLEALGGAGFDAASIDLTLLTEDAEEQLGVQVERGLALLAGAVDTRGLQAPGTTVASVARVSVAAVRATWSRVGLPLQTLPTVALTPTCGLAGRPPQVARDAIAAARTAGRMMAEDPEGDLDG